jgi:hypothetical protein
MATDKILEDIRDELRRMNGTLDRIEAQGTKRVTALEKVSAFISAFISGLGQFLSEWKALRRKE